MKQVAILSGDRQYYNYQDDYQLLGLSLSDWSEVSNEDYQLLKSWCGRDNSYTLITREDVNSKFVPRLISEFTMLAHAEKEKQEREKQKREEAKLNRELKKKAKTEADEKKLLETLRSKYKES